MSIILVGNKTDIESHRTVSTEEGQRFARENNLLFVEASAKNASNVEAAFMDIAKAIYEKIKEGTIHPSDENSGVRMGPSIAANSRLAKKQTNGGCCS
mmetsp:Transcript_10272/g.10206  ORF Transcript_10272/g.10206 Transcript_10272/m.10206 type:complete len:98 (+) Transcript_10272:317-610(+)